MLSAVGHVRFSSDPEAIPGKVHDSIWGLYSARKHLRSHDTVERNFQRQPSYDKIYEQNGLAALVCFFLLSSALEQRQSTTVLCMTVIRRTRPPPSHHRICVHFQCVHHQGKSWQCMQASLMLLHALRVLATVARIFYCINPQLRSSAAAARSHALKKSGIE